MTKVAASATHEPILPVDRMLTASATTQAIQNTTQNKTGSGQKAWTTITTASVSASRQN
jgi:hypothetical protein